MPATTETAIEADPKLPIIHELGRGDRVDAVGHRHHRRAPGIQQRGGHRGFQFLADRAGLARVQHYCWHLPLG
jgi:hypothetical protein